MNNRTLNKKYSKFNHSKALTHPLFWKVNQPLSINTFDKMNPYLNSSERFLDQDSFLEVITQAINGELEGQFFVGVICF